MKMKTQIQQKKRSDEERKRTGGANVFKCSPTGELKSS